MHLERGGISTDAKEIKKSAARTGQAALLLKLALDAPLSEEVVERTSERSTDAREWSGLLASCRRDQTQKDVRKHKTYQHQDNKHQEQDFANSWKSLPKACFPQLDFRDICQSSR